ncbi:hypothetical protein [Acidipropionibacterium thoenii]|uniref:hypothetical protein n=1 Tax=Acidipropionibacterium thoenii TaxID=1751 RepID=UPI00040895A4|nr:hypothetical protein [Acidipropionibacterium thoenii]
MSEEPTSWPRRGIPESSQPQGTDRDSTEPRSSAARRGLPPESAEQAAEPDQPEDADPDAAFRRPAAGGPRSRRRDRHRQPSRSSSGEPVVPASPQASPPLARAAADPSEDAAGPGRGSSGRHSTGRHAQPGADELVVDRGSGRRWWLWGLVAVLLAAIVVVTVSRFTHRTPMADAPSGPASSSGSATPLPQDALMSAPEATLLDPKSSWQVASTVATVSADSPEAISCIVRDTSHPNPLSTWQRAFTSSAGTGTSALNRVDSYPDVATARTAYASEAASLAACDSVPALIVSASTITGLADQAMAVTFAFQGAATQYRTVVLARTGREIQALDAASSGSPVAASLAAEAIAKAAARSCRPAAGSCPTTVRTTQGVPPVSGEPGWLITSDLPRLTADQGEWQAAAPAGVSSKGTQCEGVTLATASGPSARQQRTYLLYKDPSAPQGFGLDTVKFTFSNAAGAQAFAKKIGDSIAGCAKTLATAKVGNAKTFTGTGDNDARIAGRSFLVTQDAGSGHQAVFQVSVTTVGNQLVYLLANVTPTYKFGDDAWTQLAVRAAQRATQHS